METFYSYPWPWPLRSASRKTEIAKNARALGASLRVASPRSNISRPPRLHGKHGGADVTASFAHQRNTPISHGELWLHHLRHQRVESDASAAVASIGDHHSISQAKFTSDFRTLLTLIRDPAHPMDRFRPLIGPVLRPEPPENTRGDTTVDEGIEKVLETVAPGLTLPNRIAEVSETVRERRA